MTTDCYLCGITNKEDPSVFMRHMGDLVPAEEPPLLRLCDRCYDSYGDEPPTQEPEPEPLPVEANTV